MSKLYNPSADSKLFKDLNTSTIDAGTVTNKTINSDYLQEIIDKTIDNDSLKFNADSRDRDETMRTDNFFISEREAIIEDTKKSVDTLLKYTCKHKDSTIDSKLINNAVTVLRKDSKEFTLDDEVRLWSSYHELALFAKPATDLGIAINQEIENMNFSAASRWGFLKFWHHPRSGQKKLINRCIFDLVFITTLLIFLILLFFKIHTGSSVLPALIKNVNELSQELNEKHQMLNELNTAKNQLNTTNYLDSSISILNYQYAIAIQTLLLRTEDYIVLTKALVAFKDISHDFCSDIVNNKDNFKYLESCQAIVMTTAKETYKNYVHIYLPLILGFMGATVYIARTIIEQLRTISYEAMIPGRIYMHIFLGGFLGLISVIFISSEDMTSELQGLNLNKVLLPFIMGYSVDLTFSLFDHIVNTMNEWIKSLRLQKEPKP